MRSNRVATIVGTGMIAGSVPCTLAILVFAQLMAARNAGHPAGGDAIGLMMMSLVAYAIAVLSFVFGIIYFGFAALKNKLVLSPWHWFGIVYSLSQITIPIVYLLFPPR
jgi:hypothetical protein